MTINSRSDTLPEKRKALYRRALILAMITIFYNIVEGVVSVWLGLEDDTLSLFGFGLDSFVEVISGVGIWHMVRRQQARPDEDPDHFERTALKITGTAFYVLAAGLVASAAWNLYNLHRPDTTFWGVVIALVSLSVMWLLIRAKEKVGREIGYELTGIGGLDAAGALGIAWFSFREGREAFAEAKGLTCSRCDDTSTETQV